MVYELPPGKYLIGDPTYAFDENMNAIMEMTDSFQREGPTKFKGRALWGAPTANGDGEFFDQNGNAYPVDGGVLGAVPVELVEDLDALEEATVMDCPNGLSVSVESGVFYFNGICVNTNPEDFDTDFDGGYDGDLSKDFFI